MFIRQSDKAIEDDFIAMPTSLHSSTTRSACLLSLCLSCVAAAAVPYKENFVTCDVNITKEDKQRFGYVEDAYLNLTELLVKYGYPAEEHDVVTSDGYILRIFRIPHGRKGRKIGPPVLLMHGMTDSPATWILTGRKYSLGYKLADSGYDVWLGGYRGSRYTRRHEYLNPDTDMEYWKFSSEEMGRYDLPAITNFILNVTKRNSLAYVGHSLGARMFFEMSAFSPEIYDKFNLVMCVGPAVYLDNVFHPIVRLFAPAAPYLFAMANTLGLQELLGRHSVLTNIIQMVCAGKQFLTGTTQRTLCIHLLFMVLGDDFDELRNEIIPIIAGHIPNGSSLKTFIHLYQSLTTGGFRRFDYGHEENRKIYGSQKPPEYDLSKTKAPISIVVGKNDWLSSVKDAERLRNKLPNVVDFHVIPHSRWQHSDYLWARDSPTIIGDRLLRLLKKYCT